MINIFVTYRCNLSCSYCFAREQRDVHAGDLRREDFARLLRWMKDSALPAAAFIGGEPTLHEGLPEMMEATAEAGIAVVLFTNGLFPTRLADRFAETVSNFVVNGNDPLGYTLKHAGLLHANLSRLSELDARITFSKNFAPGAMDYEYLLDAASRYGVRAVRYDISRPSASAGNRHVPMAESRDALAHVATFVRRCESRGIRTGLDCALRLCDLSDEDRRYLERVSMKFTGICHPSIDIHPDLSASYCLPLHDVLVPDVTRFTDAESLMHHFSALVRGERYEGVSPECRDCPDFRRLCQGGCMALRRHSSAAAMKLPPAAISRSRA